MLFHHSKLKYSSRDGLKYFRSGACVWQNAAIYGRDKYKFTNVGSVIVSAGAGVDSIGERLIPNSQTVDSGTPWRREFGHGRGN